MTKGGEGGVQAERVRVRVRVRVSKAVARRQRPAWRRAVRVAHAHEAHCAGRLRPGLLERFQRQCSRLLPRAEHLVVGQAVARSAVRAVARGPWREGSGGDSGGEGRGEGGGAGGEGTEATSHARVGSSLRMLAGQRSCSRDIPRSQSERDATATTARGMSPQGGVISSDEK